MHYRDNKLCHIESHIDRWIINKNGRILNFVMYNAVMKVWNIEMQDALCTLVAGFIWEIFYNIVIPRSIHDVNKAKRDTPYTWRRDTGVHVWTSNIQDQWYTPRHLDQNASLFLVTRFNDRYLCFSPFLSYSHSSFIRDEFLPSILVFSLSLSRSIVYPFPTQWEMCHRLDYVTHQWWINIRSGTF